MMSPGAFLTWRPIVLGQPSIRPARSFGPSLGVTSPAVKLHHTIDEHSPSELESKRFMHGWVRPLAVDA
jgi:hypothetical protein